MSDDLDDIDPDSLADADLAPIFDPRAVPMSWTVLSAYDQSAAHARYKAERGRTDEGSLAMKLGRGFHAVALDQPFAVYNETKQRRGKVWEAFKAAHPNMPILSPAEHAKAFAMAHALHGDRDAQRLIYGDGVIREGVINWIRDGRRMVSHVDFRKPGHHLGDLKGVKSADPDRYQFTGLRLGHHAQVVLYDEADAFDVGRDIDDEIPLYIVTIENSAPYCVVVWELDAMARMSAARRIARWWERMKSCEASNHWPGYSQAIRPFTADDPEKTEGFSLAEPRERPEIDNDKEQAA